MTGPAGTARRINPNPAPAGGALVPQAEAGDARPDDPRGFAYAFGAYVIWGLVPLYMKAVAEMSPIEIVAHRVIWSVPVAGAVLFLLGRTGDLKAAFRSPRTIALAGLTALLIAVNWATYVYAIITDRAVDAALGYYINPLLNVVLGAVFLGERFTAMQRVAVGLAVAGVAILTVEHGGLPWISLVLAGAFGTYGILRKTLPIGPAQGFMLEVLLLLPAAVGFVVYLAMKGTGHFGFSTGHFGSDTLLLLFAGPVTAAPLILYANGAKLLRFSTIGLMQYLTPTMIFLLALFVFHEPFSLVEFVAFAFIWTGLGVYTSTLLRKKRG